MKLAGVPLGSPEIQLHWTQPNAKQKRYAPDRRYRGRRKVHDPVLDVLPEEMHFTDDGCEVAPSCLACPLEQCRHDNPGWWKSFHTKQRYAPIAEAFLHGGRSVSQVAVMFKVSPRTVHRAVRHYRAAL